MGEVEEEGYKGGSALSDYSSDNSDRTRKSDFWVEFLLQEIDKQLDVMQCVHEEASYYTKVRQKTAYLVSELQSSYQTGAFMADYVINENGIVTDVRYDWVK